MPLKQFEREYQLYQHVICIPFFTSYRKWKSFVEWKTTVKTHKMLHYKKVLQSELFILHPVHRSCLVRLRQLCHELSTLRLFHIEPDLTDSMGDFCDKQAAQKQRVEGMLEQCGGKILDLVLRSCQTSLRDFLDACGFVHHQDEQPGAASIEVSAIDTLRSATGTPSTTGGTRIYDFREAVHGDPGTAEKILNEITYTEVGSVVLVFVCEITSPGH